ncbi:MAG: glycoside hydrolase family 3 C-terminal domain-containing protein [Bifidobacteriaceae bacterium]|jgi:beta-glucosidase|nr:glycoside hydrolase family 3 C-terminal domain-containing protein [Bifidobacteriaceae bacterium]
MIKDQIPARSNLTEEHISQLITQLRLEDKVRLLTGQDFWSTWPLESIGLRRLVLSDGPSGVRGEVWDERSPSLNPPSATALSSAWDRCLAWRYGAVCATEARRKGVDVILGPTINLHRSPLGGRHFEAFSEDPLLTGELAAAYVAGVQAGGVGATPKHYVANDFETERFTADVVVSQRALRELYLWPFEKTVQQAGAWLVMSAYNSVNGATMTQNDLLETPLKSEWGFAGVVVSDWTAVRHLDSARYSQDLVMPGPSGPWGDALVEAVEAGRISETTIDTKVRRILRLAGWLGAIAGVPPAVEDPVTELDGIGLARNAASAGSVLLRNNALLPIAADVHSIAVLGENARSARTQGGGSATVFPETVVSPLEGIRQAFPEADVRFAVGAIAHQGITPLALDRLTNPVTGGPGVQVELLDAEGAVVFAEERFASKLLYMGGDAPVGQSATVRLSTRYTPDQTGPLLLGFAATGQSRLIVDGQIVGQRKADLDGTDVGGSVLDPPSASARLTAVANQPLDIRLEADLPQSGDPLAEAFADAFALTVGTEPDPEADSDELLRAAADLAAQSDVAVVVVGTNEQVESEGYDRTSLQLPGRQDDLVRAVAAANPQTLVIVNAGSPVVMDWREEVAAILLTYFGGQEYGHAVGDMLTGVAEPGGRLPTTWPALQEDVPVLDVTPRDGQVRYDEGIHVGYRAWLKSGVSPAYPFGFGLGYTTWGIELVGVEREAGATSVQVVVTNTGARPGKQVIQVYAEKPDSVVDRPVRWLVDFAAVHLDAGCSATLSLRLEDRALAYWDDEWRFEPGEYTVRVGFSLFDLPERAVISL